MPILSSDVSGVNYSWELIIDPTNPISSEVSGYPTDNTVAFVPTSIQNTDSIPHTLIYEFTVDYEGCVGNSELFSITVDPAPTVDFDISDQSVCSGGTSAQVALSSLSNDVSITWTIDSSLYPDITGITQESGTNSIPSFNLSNGGPNTIDLEFIAQIVTNSSAGCNGSTIVYTITVNPAAEMDAVDDLVYCHGDVTSIINFSTPQTEGATSFEWTISTDIGLTPLVGTGPIEYWYY